MDFLYLSTYENNPNLRIWSHPRHYGYFDPAFLKKRMPTAEVVHYYIVPWMFHTIDPMDPSWAANGLRFEIHPLEFDKTCEEHFAKIKAHVYPVPTLVILQNLHSC